MDMLQQFKCWVMALVMAFKANGIDGFLDEMEAITRSQWDPQASGLKRAGQGGQVVSIVVTLVVAAVIAYIGLIILSDVQETGSFESGSTFENSSTSLLSGVESVYGLMPVVFIALFVGVIIAALMSVNVR